MRPHNLTSRPCFRSIFKLSRWKTVVIIHVQLGLLSTISTRPSSTYRLDHVFKWTTSLKLSLLLFCTFSHYKAIVKIHEVATAYKTLTKRPIFLLRRSALFENLACLYYFNLFFSWVIATRRHRNTCQALN